MILKRILRTAIIVLYVSFHCLSVRAQDPEGPAKVISYISPSEYEIAEISISGVRFLDPDILVQISGLVVGDTIAIPGEFITNAIEKLWRQGLFSDVRITKTKVENGKVWLDIYLQERPRLSRVEYFGASKTEIQDIIEKVSLRNGTQVTENVLNNARRTIEDHFLAKGFYNIKVNIVQKDDPKMPNGALLNVYIEKNDKVRIEDIHFVGNNSFEDKRLRRVLKNTKRRNLNFFKSSKYVEEKFEEDKDKLKAFYNEAGFRDFELLSDSIALVEDDRMELYIRVKEGKKYYFRNIRWIGNSKYPTGLLDAMLGIEKGEPYNQVRLMERLIYDEDAVNSVYLDNGYLFNQMIPVEMAIDGDSIDLEIRVLEGEPATVNKIIIKGNTKTNEHVIRREILTYPGDLFSKDLTIRSARQLAVLGHFDPEKISPLPLPNPAESTVDMEYNLEEKANDQFEISGGWGAGMLIGTVGLRFNNFSIRNVLDGKAWRPVPSGDGQTLSLRAQTNGRIYQSYNVSFVEPWLGGTKPNTFSVSLYRSVQTNGQKKGEDGRQAMVIDGATVGFGKRLSWPDDYFSTFFELSYQRYNMQNFNYGISSYLFNNGVANNLSFTASLNRYSEGRNPIYPTQGSTFKLSLQVTPPYSLLNGKDFAASDITQQDKYQWIEYHKWTMQADFYYKLAGNLVLSTRARFGYLGFYNKDIGPAPFENFYVGGDGMVGFSIYGREVVAMRGYTNGSLTPNKNGIQAGNLYSKLTFELRYPISLNPQATVYALAFLEAGRAWYELSEFNPFRMNRSAGVGLRANLPMFGLLGIDWGYGFDEAVNGDPDANGGQIHFLIGKQF